ncbi:MAG: hypothetical protein IJ011_00345 [Clostridia bacterium]|nr:hypothetical protein [Clostridia bacterium]
MAKINKQHKWDTCIHALCPFGRGFALCSYGMDFPGKELSAKDFPICMAKGVCRKEEAKKKTETK